VTERREVVEAIDSWARQILDENPVVEAVDVGSGDEPWWRVRVRGEDKDVYTVHYRLRQRTLSYETFYMPEPEDNHARCFAQLLERNSSMRLLRFWIGDENAVFLGGWSPISQVNADQLDEILGSIYEAVELCFRSSLRIGFPRLMNSE
jgi:hypothetical protein